MDDREDGRKLNFQAYQRYSTKWGNCLPPLDYLTSIAEDFVMDDDQVTYESARQTYVLIPYAHLSLDWTTLLAWYPTESSKRVDEVQEWCKQQMERKRPKTQWEVLAEGVTKSCSRVVQYIGSGHSNYYAHDSLKVLKEE